MNSCVVKVNQISKIYKLWHSPKHRLIFSFKKMWKKYSSSDYFREFYALDNTTFEINKGESWGFIGLNGSGKSTLLKIISGNLRPSSGFVEVDGKVAILDYSNGFHGDFTGKENIYIKATLLGLTRKQINERYAKIVEFAELGDFINQPIKTYSSGMVARLGFAIMTQVDADIIISDEALAVGDIFFVQKCMRFINDFLKKGTFLFVSHSTNDVATLCKKAVWLESGKIKAIGSAKAVTEAYLNKESFIEKEEDQLDNPFKKATASSIAVLGIANNYPKNQNSFKDARLINLKLENLFPPIKKSVSRAEIVKVALSDEKGKSLSQIIGCETAILSIEIQAKEKLNSPIVSFQLYDRLGQVLFSDYTRTPPLVIQHGGKWLVKFSFQMPLLPPGDYVIGAKVILVPDNESAIEIASFNPALVIHSVTTGPRHGIVGIPMMSIKLKCLSVPDHSRIDSHEINT